MENNKNEKEEKVPELIDQTKPEENNTRRANVYVDDIAYHLEYEPFFFNEQVRYYVSVNAKGRNVFVWDKTVDQFRAINDGAGVLPVALEQAISVHLLSQNLT